MRTLRLWCIVMATVGVVAVGFRESHGADPMSGVIGQDEGAPQSGAAAEESAVVPLTVNRTGPEPPPAVAPFDAEQARAHQEAWAKHLGLPVEWTNSIGMKFVLIPPGEFMMGSDESPNQMTMKLFGGSQEWHGKRQHRVRITQPFYLGLYEVTQGQYEAVMGDNPSRFKGAQHPVERVSWHDAVEFCGKLSVNREEQTVETIYRLPTEAEWEYSTRAGSTTAHCYGDDRAYLGDHAWYDANSDRKTQLVGKKQPNAWGLYDMLGNVWEWCQDWVGAYPKKSVTDPQGPTEGSYRVLHGGGWGNDLLKCRPAHRFARQPSHRASFIGLRVALSPSGVTPVARQKK